MKKHKSLLLLFLIMISVPSIAFSQPEKPKDGEYNLYAEALFASIAKMKAAWGHIADKAPNRTPTDYDRMIVEKRLEITDGLPSKRGEMQVEYLDQQALIEQSKNLEKEFSILVGHPMKSEGKRLRVSFTTHWITYGKRKLTYALSDWSHVYFRFDCQQERYVIDDIQLGGI